MHLPLARLVSMYVIFCLLPSSSIVILVFHLFSISVNSMCSVRTVSVNIVNTVSVNYSLVDASSSGNYANE